ncbi:MAG: FtsX-like permease family protein [Planctomycetota bacterium]|nr:FtsX-like permease family protein [Planctomycetota bacterium]
MDAAATGRAARRALSPWTYLLRNPRRILPLFGIQALVTCLLVLIITPTNAFEATAEANVRPLEIFTIVSPRLRREFDEELLAVLDANPHQQERVRAKMLWVRTPMIVGEGYAPLIALPVEVRDAFLKRVELTLVDGRLPEPGEDGAVLHEAVVRARGMKLGDKFGQLIDPTDPTPGRFTLVGTLAGESRMGIADFAYADQPFFVLARRDPFQVVYANAGAKDASDAYLHAATQEDGESAFRVVDDDYVRGRIEANLKNLPLILGFITFSVAIVVALVIALLNMIAFQVRVDEFGLLLAIGHARRRLVGKLAAEAFAVAATGWLVGLALGLLGVWIYDQVWLAPQGILLRVLDPRPLLFSMSVPVLSTLTGAIALARRLRRMDPVAVIQRRGV